MLGGDALLTVIVKLDGDVADGILDRVEPTETERHVSVTRLVAFTISHH